VRSCTSTAACTLLALSPVRSLALVRHAKSGYPEGVADHERPLADRGRRDAPQIGVAIDRQFGIPDLVLVSSATRTEQTWSLAANQWSDRPAQRAEPRLYDAAPGEVLDVIREVSSSIGTLVIVGHLPGVTDLAARLGQRSSLPALTQLNMKFPTSGVALFTVSDEWLRCEPTTCELVDFVVARG
jgi:phosphohistidine phosphatase